MQVTAVKYRSLQMCGKILCFENPAVAEGEWIQNSLCNEGTSLLRVHSPEKHFKTYSLTRIKAPPQIVHLESDRNSRKKWTQMLGTGDAYRGGVSFMPTETCMPVIYLLTITFIGISLEAIRTSVKLFKSLLIKERFEVNVQVRF